MQQRKRQHQDGLTLVEMMVSVAILMLVLVPTLMSLRSSERSTNDLRTATEVRAQVRFAMDTLVRDFRQAQTADSSLAPVVSVSGTTLTFYSPDRSTPFRLRKITYTINGALLTRSVTVSTNSGAPPWTFGTTTPASEFAFSLKPGSLFVAKNAAGAVTTTPADVRRLDVTLIVNGLPREGAAQTFTQSVETRTAS
jgi:type II secretory pathway pseudopilin PulG